MTSPTPFATPAPLILPAQADSPSLADQRPGGLSLTLPRDRLSAAIVNCLRQRAGGIVYRAELVEWIWGDHESGGPDDPYNDIDVTICRLRKKGFPIKTHFTIGFSYAADRHEYCDEPYIAEAAE